MGKALSFIAGMLVGIILFIVAIGGTIYILATGTTLEKLQTSIGVDIVADGSDLSDDTVWDVGKKLYESWQNLGTLTINDLIKMGVKIPDTFSGINVSGLYSVPLKDLPQNLGTVLDNVTLSDIGTFAGIDFASYNMPILEDNLNVQVVKALDNVLKSIDSNTMSLRAIEQNFGLTLGESELFDSLKDVPLSSFATLVEALPVSTLLGVDSDLFVKVDTSYQLYFKADSYTALTDSNVLSTADGAKEYVSGAVNGNLVYKELRYVKKTVENADGTVSESYVVNNTPWSEGFDAATDENEYFRYNEYAAVGTGNVPSGTSEFYIRPVLNLIEQNGSTYTLAVADYTPIGNYYTYEGGSYVALTRPSGATTLTFDTATEYFSVDQSATGYDENDKSTWTYIKAQNYGFDPAVYGTLDKDARLADNYDGYLRLHKGTSDAAIQAIGNTTINGLNNVTDDMMKLQIGELISIDENSTQILQTLKNTPMNGLSSAIDGLKLNQIIDIVLDAYTPDAGGNYVYVKEVAGVCQNATPSNGDGYYTLFNPTAHAGFARYAKTSVGYVVASSFDSATTYYADANGTALGTQPNADNFGDGTYYVKTASSVIQRLSTATVDSLANAFDNVVLGDVIDIDVDEYTVVDAAYISANTNQTYFRFDDGAYLSADAAYRGEHPSETYYIVSKSGSSSAVLKRMAYLAVGNLGNKMDAVVDDMLISEIVDIVKYDEFSLSTLADADANYLVDHNPYFTIGSGDDVTYVAYTYNPDGKYYRTDVAYETANAIQKGTASTTYYRYVALPASATTAGGELYDIYTQFHSADATSNTIAIAAAQAQAALDLNAKHYYFKSEKTSKFNSSTVYSLYVLKSATSASDMGGKFYTRVLCSSTDSGAIEAQTYAGENLYVESELASGTYETYTGGVHQLGKTIYFKYTDRYYLASAEILADESVALYTFSSGAYSEVADRTSAVASASTSAVYCRMPQFGGSDAVYFTPVDGSVPAGEQLYSKNYCTSLFSQNATGAYVKIGNDFVAYDKTVHGTDAIRYNAFIGYVAGYNETHSAITGVALSSLKVSIDTAKSAAVMMAFANKNVRVGTLGSVLNDFTLGDILNIEPDSMFDDEELLNAKIDDLSSVLQSKLTGMTIGQILTWGNITTMKPATQAVLNDVMLEDLFGAIEISSTYDMVFNIEEMYDVATYTPA